MFVAVVEGAAPCPRPSPRWGGEIDAIRVQRVAGCDGDLRVGGARQEVGRLAHLIAIAAAAGAAAWVTCGSAWAASDITIAAIATGRLYVVGSTDQPHTPVVLDGQFRTESDDQGKFQYELVYHPPRCIVSALIAGKAHEAVVSNCGESCALPPPGGAGKPQVTGRAPQAAPAIAAQSDATVEAPSAGGRAVPPPGNPIARPPLPPQRPSFGLGT